MPNSMKAPLKDTFRSALLAALLTAVLATPVLGLRLEPGNTGAALAPQWRPVLLAVAAVFLFHLTRPLWRRLAQRLAGGPGRRVRAALQGPVPSRLARLARRGLGPEPQRRLLLSLLLLGALWPLWAERSALDVGTLALTYVLLGLGLNIVVGQAGLLDLGYVGFYAVGGYTYALLNQMAGLGFWQSLPLAAGMAALFGFLLGFPVLRLRGDYLAIVTLGFGEIIRLMLNNLGPFTGGPDGIAGIAKPGFFGIEIARSASVAGGRTLHELMGWEYDGVHMVVYLYAIALALVALALFFSARLARMPMGRAWEALREDEIACRSLGLDPTRIKLSAFTLGAAFAGVAGAFFAARQGLVNPESFTFIESALILAVVVLGGMGSPLGVVLAALLLTVLPELARGFAEYRMLAFGLVMVLMMMWRPQGLLPPERRAPELPR